MKRLICEFAIVGAVVVIFLIGIAYFMPVIGVSEQPNSVNDVFFIITLFFWPTSFSLSPLLGSQALSFAWFLGIILGVVLNAGLYALLGILFGLGLKKSRAFLVLFGLIIVGWASVLLSAFLYAK